METELVTQMHTVLRANSLKIFHFSLTLYFIVKFSQIFREMKKKNNGQNNLK